jgi:hypothetical protein
MKEGPPVSAMILWNTPIRATWSRSMQLLSLEYKPGSMTMTVNNDGDGKVWSIRFYSIQAIEITTYECASSILRDVEGRGALFEVIESRWIEELGRGKILFLEKSRHFVVCCYDEVVEVVAHRFDFIEEHPS